MSVGGPHRSAIALIALVLAVSAAAAPAGAGPRPAAPPRASVGSAVASATSPTARLARSDAALLRLRGSRPIPVMVRFDVDPIASYAGGIPGLASDESRRDGQPPSGFEPRSVVPAVPDEQDDLDRGLDPSHGSGNPDPSNLRRRVRRRLDAGSRRPRARCPAGPGCRGGPAGPSGPHAHDHHPALPGRRPGLAHLGRSGSGGAERGHRGAGLGHLARTPIVQGPRPRTVPPCRRVRVRRRLRPRLGEAVHL